jgi:hypothetical protein
MKRRKTAPILCITDFNFGVASVLSRSKFVCNPETVITGITRIRGPEDYYLLSQVNILNVSKQTALRVPTWLVEIYHLSRYPHYDWVDLQVLGMSPL